MRRTPNLNHRQVLVLMRKGENPRVVTRVEFNNGARVALDVMLELEALGVVVRVGDHWELK